MKRQNQLTGTLNAWSKAIGVETKTLTIRLTKSGVTVEPFKHLTARQVFCAMIGAKEDLEIQRLAAQNEKLCRENAIANRQIFKREEMESFLGQPLQGLGNELRALPRTLGGQQKTRLAAAGVAEAVIAAEQAALDAAVESILQKARGMTK
jgi:hypothetical protein